MLAGCGVSSSPSQADDSESHLSEFEAGAVAASETSPNPPEPTMETAGSTANESTSASDRSELELETPAPAQATTFVIPGNPDLDYAQVTFVTATQSSDGSWRFDTTVRHEDQGWDDYADAWQVVHPETGEVIAERILLHPHDNEQPFTRSQNNIIIPPELTQVIVRAKDNVEGFGGQEVIVDLTGPESEYFEVIRQ